MPLGPEAASIRRRRLLKGLAAAGFSVSLAGCGNGTSREFEIGPGDRSYVAGATSEAQSLSPTQISDEATTDRLDLLYDTGGVIDDEDQSFEGRLLSSWELSEDARTVRYEVRDGLQWGAGYGQLTAEDYVYTARNVFQSEWALYSQRPFFFLGGEPIEYEQTGELSFEANLPARRPNWLHEDVLYGVYPLPKGLVEQYEPDEEGGDGDPEGMASDEAITSGELNGNLGPFDLESWEKGQRLVVSKNEDYYLADTDVGGGEYAGSPSLSSYTYQVFDERTTAYSAVKAGDITSVGVEARKVDELSNAAGVSVWESTFGDGIFWLNLNFRANGWDPLGESRQVRQAMAHLLDRGTLIDQIFAGNANPVDTFHPRWGPYYSDEKITTFEPSVERARTKFENGTGSDHGYDERGRFVGPDGEQVELTVVIDNTDRQGEIVGNFMRRRLEKAGFAVTIDGLPFNRILDTYLKNSPSNVSGVSEPDYNAGPYNAGPPDQSLSREPWDIIYGVGFSASPYAPWQPIEGTLTPQGTFNFTGYRTDDYDIREAIDDAPGASPEETQRIMTDLFGFLSRDQPFVWAFNDHLTAAYRQTVEGIPEAENFFDGPSSRLLSLSTEQAGTPPEINATAAGTGTGTGTGTPTPTPSDTPTPTSTPSETSTGGTPDDGGTTTASGNGTDTAAGDGDA